ncbi:hypothetical protein BLA29_005332 [Euroglyphus maynei]|uniref:Uncharacterized protein n=1 Tax=Euroglyphus maynei TaxID=6958 RepID=A0A1Y3BEA6_EURMA|nr:hypothetical protein BLA29_005332 [Euroglyphus maynei]
MDDTLYIFKMFNNFRTLIHFAMFILSNESIYLMSIKSKSQYLVYIMYEMKSNGFLFAKNSSLVAFKIKN